MNYADANALNLSSYSIDTPLFEGPVILSAAMQSDSDSYEFDANGVMTKLIILKESDGSNWTYTLDNLPAFDENGNPYYYWAVESPVQGYSPSYSFEDDDSNTQTCINASNPGSGIITIMNTAKETSVVTLPATGGRGTRWYYVIGFMLMTTSISAYYITKRYRYAKK